MIGPIRDEWLPPIEDLKDWFEEMRQRLKSNPPPMHGVVKKFEDFVRTNDGIFKLVNNMISTAKDPKVCVPVRAHVLNIFLSVDRY